ncbi:MAG: sugar-binding transcriptional regulator [Rhizobiaceae bacterium]|nr:MAG: sugar-binding transcriptional regulator [Rhizobiaceae bacterium]
MRESDQTIHRAAWLYYTHNLRQEEVARVLNISRASVAGYLRKARERGVVTVSTSTELFRQSALARQLEDRLGLATVWIVPDDSSFPPAMEIPFVAANAFLSLIGPGTRIAVAWGRTVYHIADAMETADLKGVTVSQICGNLGAPYDYRPDQCTMEIARRLNAEGINLYAPLVLSSEDLAGALRHEDVVDRQLASIATCDIVLYSVGGVEADSHIVSCGALPAEDLPELHRQGATGVIGGQLIDRGGLWMDCPYNRRVISADLDDVKRIPIRFMVVIENEKHDALNAALRGGFATHLVISEELGKRLLAG